MRIASRPWASLALSPLVLWALAAPAGAQDSGCQATIDGVPAQEFQQPEDALQVGTDDVVTIVASTRAGTDFLRVSVEVPFGSIPIVDADVTPGTTSVERQVEISEVSEIGVGLYEISAEVELRAPLSTSRRSSDSGEPTHGSHEQFAMKLRIVQFLVEHAGFRTVAFENDFATGLAIDRYVTTGVGDPVALVSEMSSPFWATEEIVDLVRWLRSYNQTHTEPVRFFGADLLQLRQESFDAITAVRHPGRPGTPRRTHRRPRPAAAPRLADRAPGAGT